ncbi:MAG: hypothetical protein WAS73_19015 [Defluviicoccus sp.]
MILKGLLCLAAAGLIAASPAHAAEPKIFPGAKSEVVEAKPGMGMPPGTMIRFYTSEASFEKVLAFYKGLYPEIAMAAPPPMLPAGQKVVWAFFSLDGTTDLTTSKHWMKIQRPAIMDARMEGGVMKYLDVRDVTLIQFIESR